MSIPSVLWGTLDVIVLEPGEGLPPRRVYLWLPPDTVAPGLVVMQDGEKVFPDTGGDVGWNVPAALMRRWEDGGRPAPAVLAVEATQNRAGEFMPEEAVVGPGGDRFLEAHRHRVYLPRSRAYLSFLLQEVLPWARSQGIHTDPCTLVGCSRGALFSIYALCKKPREFVGAACLSPHWPHGDGLVVSWLSENLPASGRHRFYFDHGDQGLDAAYGPYQERVDSIMTNHGFAAAKDYVSLFFPGHGHEERYWRDRVGHAIAFVLDGRVVDEEEPAWRERPIPT